MVCDSCDENREAGYKFCPVCGGPLMRCCEECAVYESRGYKYCGKCGMPLNPTEEKTGLLKKAPLIIMPLVVILMALEIVVMFTEFSAAWHYTESGHVNWFLLLLSLTVVSVVTGLGLKIWWIALVLIIIASCAFMLTESKAMFRPGKDSGLRNSEKTPLYWLCMLFGASFTVSIIVTAVQGLFGLSLETPEWILEMDLGEAMLSCANAAVAEEIAGRVVPIGLPFVLFALINGRKDCARYFLGGMGVSRASIILILFSAALFGFAHFSGWGWAKVLPTLCSGILMGYLYVRFGLYASIVFHFLTDYMLVLTLSLPITIVAILEIAVILMGVLCFFEMMRRLYAGLKDIRSLPVTGLEDQDSRE